MSESGVCEDNNPSTGIPGQGLELLPKYTSRERGQTVGNWLRKPHRLRGAEGLTDRKHKQRAMKWGGCEHPILGAHGPHAGRGVWTDPRSSADRKML